jgi:hypothetical protein
MVVACQESCTTQIGGIHQQVAGRLRADDVLAPGSSIGGCDHQEGHCNHHLEFLLVRESSLANSVDLLIFLNHRS